MPGKRRRTQLNYKTIARCALTNKVIRYVNVETQTSPVFVVSRLYVALERLDGKVVQSYSSNSEILTGLHEENQQVSVALDAMENDASVRNSLALNLESSQEQSPARVNANAEDEEYECPQTPASNSEVPDSNTTLSSPAHSIGLVSSAEESEADDQGKTAEESEANEESDDPDKTAFHSMLLPIASEEINARVGRSNLNAEDFSANKEEKEDDEQEEDSDSDGEDDKTKKRRKKVNKYIKIKAHTVHIHNHFYEK